MANCKFVVEAVDLPGDEGKRPKKLGFNAEGVKVSRIFPLLFFKTDNTF
ncbi:MAG: hypothetical protein PHW04_15505 [Candidatus Wallbacteria bacterium]|nr:hypothetical protein [Candidatus Wallbacteria bacterium]